MVRIDFISLLEGSQDFYFIEVNTTCRGNQAPFDTAAGEGSGDGSDGVLWQPY